MATPFWRAAIAPREDSAGAEIAAGPCETTSLNLPENSDSIQQQEVLDALPVLVFLERAGNVVYVNAEARQRSVSQTASGSQRPVEDVLWGLFRDSGTADPSNRATKRKPISCHVANPQRTTSPSKEFTAS